MVRSKKVPTACFKLAQVIGFVLPINKSTSSIAQQWRVPNESLIESIFFLSSNLMDMVPMRGGVALRSNGSVSRPETRF